MRPLLRASVEQVGSPTTTATARAMADKDTQQLTPGRVPAGPGGYQLTLTSRGAITFLRVLPW